MTILKNENSAINKFTLGDLRDLLKIYHKSLVDKEISFTKEIESTHAFLEMLVNDLDEEENSLILFDGNADNSDQPYMLELYAIVFKQFELNFENGHDMHQGGSPLDKLYKELHDRLNMNLPYHPPFQLTKDSPHYQKNLSQNKGPIVMYRGDSRDPLQLFGLKDKDLVDNSIANKELTIRPLSSGNDVLDSPVIAVEKNIICGTKKFRTAVMYPLALNEDESKVDSETWVYLLVPDKLYDVHEHAKSFLPMAIRSNEKIYTYIQSRLRSYEIIAEEVAIENVIAAIKVKRLPTTNILSNPPKFILGEIISNPRCTLMTSIKQTAFDSLIKLKEVNEKVWQLDKPDSELRQEEKEAIQSTKAEEAFIVPSDKDYGRPRKRSIVGHFFEPKPSKEIDDLVNASQEKKENELPTEEDLQRFLRDA